MQQTGLFRQSQYGNGNQMVFSRLHEFERNNQQFPHLAIRYVIDGTETYAFDQKVFPVTGGRFVLINPARRYDVSLRSESPVTGICMNIDTAVIKDVCRTLTASPEQLLDAPDSIIADPLDIYEGIYKTSDCGLGSFLERLASNYAEFEQGDHRDLYYQIAGTLLVSQGLLQKKIKKIAAGSFVTQKELYRRVEHGRTLIDDCFRHPLNLQEIAAHAAMSPFHFNRTFKQVYGVPPYQYLIKKRLEQAKEYLLQQRYTVGEIGLLTGFADIHSFSKSFKKAYNISPSAYMET